MENNDNRKEPAKVEMIDGGPIKITGNIILEDLKRDIVLTGNQTVYLCTCGDSGNMPYCDESHLKKLLPGNEEQ
jgi:CDGSH-type Zn-finger protein